MKRKPAPRKRKPKTPKTKTAPPVIHITINVTGKAKPVNSKAALLMYDKYVAKRQGYEFSEMI